MAAGSQIKAGAGTEASAGRWGMLPLAQEPRQAPASASALVGSGGRNLCIAWLRGWSVQSGEGSSDGLGETEAGPEG